MRADSGPVEGAGGQKRRLALLALLDAAGERGMSRDKLLGLLWPESEAKFDTDGKRLLFTIADDEADVAVVNLRRP